MDEGYTLDGKKTAHPVAISAFNSAKISNMCQSVVTPDVPIFGSISLVLRAGQGDKKVEAKNLYIDVAQLKAEATFTNINIGVAAGSTSKGPGIGKGDKANPYGFAQEADRAVLTDVEQTAWATSAGTFKLSGLNMRLHKGVKECY
jgi:hypothetical protein